MLYELITQAIIILRQLRIMVQSKLHYNVRNERTFRLVTAESGRHYHICCDCGLEHLDKVEGDKTVVIWSKPMRPLEYKYNLRYGAAEPAEHHSVEEWRKRGFFDRN
jgi:hypothetical protein